MMLIDPYEILGVARNADDEQIKAAYRRQVKATHPDTGGDTDQFVQGKRAFDLLTDPLRRKVFDATGYDPELADPTDLQGVMVIEKLVNDIVLDERAAGTFDPLARMRASLAEEIRKAKFHIKEMEGHSARIMNHIDRLDARPETDILGYMLRARVSAIDNVIGETKKKIDATERAREMLESYTYCLDLGPAPANQHTAPQFDIDQKPEAMLNRRGH